MERDKLIENIRKRNSELNRQLEELKSKFEDLESKQSEVSYSNKEQLISDMEELKNKWMSSIELINKCEERYSMLNEELKVCLNIMKSMGFKIPWHKKLLFKLKHRNV